MSYPLILVAQKGIKDRDGSFTRVDSLDAPYPDILAIIRQAGAKLVPNSARPAARFSGDKQSVDSLEKMKKAGIPLGQYVKGGIYFGIKTAFNKAFVLDQETKERLIRANPECSEVIRPLALGKDIRKWSIEQRGRWLIVTRIGIPIKRYPAVFAHLSQWQAELRKRKDQGDHWWELRACAYYDVFEQPKIIWGNMGLEPRFAFSSEPLYALAPANVIPVNDLFLLGLLNSRLGKEFFADVSIQRGADYLEFKPVYVRQFPVPLANASQRNSISALVQKCLDANGQDCGDSERLIDERVAALYGF